MFKIKHPSPSFSGSVIACARRFEFTNGEASADLRADQVAILRLQGFTIEPTTDTEPAPVEAPKPKRAKVADKPVEINDVINSLGDD